MQSPEFYEIYTRNGDLKRQHPFLIAVQRNVHRCAQYCPLGLRMDFVFSKSTVKHVNSAIDECFTVVKREAENEPIGERIGSHGYADCRHAAPLQAADLLAYQAHKYCRTAAGDHNFKVGEIYNKALRRFQHKDDFWLWDEGRFEHLAMLAALYKEGTIDEDRG